MTITAMPVTAVVVGAGARGSTYSRYALHQPDQLQIVGVAEPRKFFRERMSKTFEIPEQNVHQTWELMAAAKKMADCAFITTQDQLHKDPAIAFAAKGYHILLEKPMAISYEDSTAIVAACRSSGVMLAVCHVLRYSPQARCIQCLIQDGAIGDVVNIQHIEQIGFQHFAHSYVRGNWRNTAQSSFSLLAKSCHDLDLIQMWMGKKKCTAVSSFGSLKHFTAANKPAGASSRCMKCPVEPSCAFSANKLYIEEGIKQGVCSRWVQDLAEIPDIESATAALCTGRYGRCVYECDNDVMDNQVVNLQFEGGATVSFNMVAFTKGIGIRRSKICGTKGEIDCDFDEPFITRFDFVTKQTETYDLKEELSKVGESNMTNHGGAAFFTVKAFVEALKTGEKSAILTGPEESLYSHMLCFAAEESRLKNCVLEPSTHPLYKDA